MSDDKTNPVEIDETNLDDVSGGLPAVQKVREAAARLQAAPEPETQAGLTKAGPGTLALGGSN